MTDMMKEGRCNHLSADEPEKRFLLRFQALDISTFLMCLYQPATGVHFDTTCMPHATLVMRRALSLITDLKSA